MVGFNSPQELSGKLSPNLRSLLFLHSEYGHSEDLMAVEPLLVLFTLLSVCPRHDGVTRRPGE